MFQPTTFGKFFLTRRIAVGGMAEVYAAKLYGADGFEKDLVIKQILPQHAKDPEFVQSFVAEAKIAVGLTHANIVTIYELGRVDGTYFIAMEYVDGLDAFAIIEACRRHGQAIPIGCAVRLVEDVAHGLDYAHRRCGPDGDPLGLVHRDLNPRNVLVSMDGDVKVLDFGIAKTAPGVADMPKTRAGVVKGTTGYMSPEQAMGLEIDARTDIYQAGLLLYELLTGTALFWRPDEEQTRARMRQHQVVPPSVVRPEVPAAVDEVVMRALARAPEQRISTAAEFAQQLAAARAHVTGPRSNQELGAMVRDLRAKEAAAVKQITGDDIPNTRDLSDVISQAIEHSITGRIETFARGPGLAEPVTKPVTGSTPLQVDLGTDREGPQVLLTATGDLIPGTARSLQATPTPRPVERGLLAPSRTPPPPDPSEQPPRRRAPWLALAALLVAGLTTLALVWTPWAERPEDPQPAEPVATRAAPASGTPAVTSTAPAQAPRPPPPSDSAAVLARSRRPPAKASPTQFGIVDFGTRSCSSRVTLDGRLVTRTTPSFGHRVAAGPHSVLIEGISCAPIERPGSLRRVQPSVSGQFEVPPAGAVKVIADFEAGRLITRRPGGS